MKKFSLADMDKGTIVEVYEYGDKLHSFTRENQEHLIPRDTKKTSYYRIPVSVYGLIPEDATHVYVVNTKSRVMFQTSIQIVRVFAKNEDAQLYADELNKDNYFSYYAVDKVKILKDK